MIRLFIALKIPSEIKRQIITLRDTINNSSVKLKWEQENKLHLTLKFIGEVPENLLEKIEDSISFIDDYEKFNCSLTGFGFFYRKNEPKILWAGLKADKRLFELADKLNKDFTRFGIPAEERKFKAHLTLLRIRDSVNKSFVDSFEKYLMPEVPFISDEIALIKSELLPGSSKYTEIKNFKLK